MKKEFWFIVGSQFLYGPETLEQVAQQSQAIVDGLNASGRLPGSVVYKATAKTDGEITQLMKDANYDEACYGVITWCHTFSPSKMWIHGLNLLQKPYCHFATQHNRNIPNEAIDMDFMNLNQSAHGDREHGFIATRMHLPRKIVAGYWEDAAVQDELGSWMRAAMGYAFSQKLRVIRFGDNMRNVAVTEGDKVEVQVKLGWQVDYWPVGHLVETMDEITDAEVNAKMDEYRGRYKFATDDLDTVRYQAREELAMRRILDREGAKAFSNNFEDLYGMDQLPGLASQNMMADGYGYGGEGDWKVAAMTAIMKHMAEGLEGGTVFMEDYTYDLVEGEETSLGAHMLEVCPSIAADKPQIETHDLGIGGKNPPARLVFEGAAGKGIVASLVDMGGRLRLILQDIEVIKPYLTMPNLPVARVMWRPEPDLLSGLKCWIEAGGAHHSTLTTALDAEVMKDWAEMMQIECLHISADTTYEAFKKEVFYNDIAWKLKGLSC